MIAEDGGAPLVGTPGLDGAAVFAEVVAQTRGDKVIVFKKNRRKNYWRTKGHRQEQTMLRIAGISASGKAPATKSDAANAEPAPETAAETPAAETDEARNAAAAPQVETQVESAPEATPESDSPKSGSKE
jgi:large subunit ribosomal protein L21